MIAVFEPQHLDEASREVSWKLGVLAEAKGIETVTSARGDRWAAAGGIIISISISVSVIIDTISFIIISTRRRR